MSVLSIFDPAAGRAARDTGMALALNASPTFNDQFFQFVLSLPIGWIGQCEDIREVWTGIPPKSHYCWGAAWNSCIKKGLLLDTGIETQMKAKRSNGRRTHLYRRV